MALGWGPKRRFLQEEVMSTVLLSFGKSFCASLGSPLVVLWFLWGPRGALGAEWVDWVDPLSSFCVPWVPTASRGPLFGHAPLLSVRARAEETDHDQIGLLWVVDGVAVGHLCARWGPLWVHSGSWVRGGPFAAPWVSINCFWGLAKWK